MSDEVFLEHWDEVTSLTRANTHFFSVCFACSINFKPDFHVKCSVPSQAERAAKEKSSDKGNAEDGEAKEGNAGTGATVKKVWSSPHEQDVRGVL